MTLSRAIKLVLQNALRTKKNFLMSGFGIVVGISTFVFFLGLGEGVRDVVLGKIFLVDQVEVVPKRFDMGFAQFDGSRPFDDAMNAEFMKMPGVADVFPKMKFTFPARAYGGKQLLGRNVWAEMIADGIDPALVQADTAALADFKDWEAPVSCDAKTICPAGRSCVEGTCTKESCEYNRRTTLSSCPGKSYCAEDTQLCEYPIPIIVSHHLLELYNGSLSTAMQGVAGGRSMPKLAPSTLLGIQANLILGKSFLGKTKTGAPISRRMELVGFSPKAITVGVTMPISYVKSFNARFSADAESGDYHSAILKVANQVDVPQVVDAVKEAGFGLADSTENAERAAQIIRTMESLFALISAVIVGIAAVNISQMFYMLIYQRRREIGLFRALGASRKHIRLLILGEAGLLGLIGGTVGIFVGLAASQLVDKLAASLPDFPYKPETFFAFPPWLWVAAISLAVLFCLLGAFLPANAAARQEPAAALTE